MERTAFRAGCGLIAAMIVLATPGGVGLMAAITPVFFPLLPGKAINLQVSDLVGTTAVGGGIGVRDHCRRDQPP